MAKVIPISERFRHFVEELQESFWGDLYGRTRQAWKTFDCESRGRVGRAFCRPATSHCSVGLPALAMLIREAFLRGLSTRQVGRVVGTLTGEVVSAADGTAVVLQLSPTPVAQTAHHQRDRRCFVELRRRTRPMVCFVNVKSADRIIYSIFQRFTG